MPNSTDTTSSSMPTGLPFLRLLHNVGSGVIKRTSIFARSVATMVTVTFNMSHAADNLTVPLQAPPSPLAGSSRSSSGDSASEAELLPDSFYPSIRGNVEDQKQETEVYLNPGDLEPHLIAVGAGPVDLIKLIRIKKQAPESILLVIERNEVYTRTHTLRLKIDSILDKDLKQRILDSEHGKLRKDKVHIGAQHLEKILSDYAKEIGIIFQYTKVVSREQIEMAFHQCKKIVFGDGAHSLMRRKVFGEDKDFIAEHPMQNVLQIQYTVKGEKKPLAFWKLEASEKLSDFLFEETVNYNPAKDESRIAARFFLDSGTNKAVPDGKEKQPISLTADMPPNVKQAISIFLNTRDDGQILNPVLTKIKLSAYTSKIYAKNENDRSWLLIGDAAFGVPYFRSLNAGIECANAVSTIVANNLKRSKYAHTQLSTWELLKINMFMLSKFTNELTVASFKDWGLDATKSVVYSVASVPTPLQINRWHRADRRRLRALHPMFIAANDRQFGVDVRHDKPAPVSPSPYATSRSILFGSSLQNNEEKKVDVGRGFEGPSLTR